MSHGCSVTFYSMRICIDTKCAKVKSWHGAHEGYESQNGVEILKQIESKKIALTRFMQSQLPDYGRIG